MQPRITFHMAGIICLCHETKDVNPTWLIPSALVSLAARGYVKVGKRVALTAQGRQLVPMCQDVLNWMQPPTTRM